MYGSKASMEISIDDNILKIKDLKVVSMSKLEMSPGKFITDVILDYKGKHSISIKIRDLD